jgi:hypothetical protein
MIHWISAVESALEMLSTEFSRTLRRYDSLPDTAYDMEMTGFVPRQIRAMLAHS